MYHNFRIPQFGRAWGKWPKMPKDGISGLAETKKVVVIYKNWQVISADCGSYTPHGDVYIACCQCELSVDFNSPAWNLPGISENLAVLECRTGAAPVVTNDVH